MLLTYRFYRYVDLGLGRDLESVGYVICVSYFDIVRGAGSEAVNHAMVWFARNLEVAKLSIKAAVNRLKQRDGREDE